MPTIKVYLIDGSSIVRQNLIDVIGNTQGMAVTGAAKQLSFAEKRIFAECPDVIILNVDDTEIEFLRFLQNIVKNYAIPVILSSSLSEKGAKNCVQGLMLGAVGVIRKPVLPYKSLQDDSAIELVDLVSAAANMNMQQHITPSHVLPSKRNYPACPSSSHVLAIGASIGGISELVSLICALPMKISPAVVATHLPETVTEVLAKHLDENASVRVKQAEEGDKLVEGEILIAPGNRHMIISEKNDCKYVQIKDGPLVARNRPSIDVLFRSAAGKLSDAVVAILLGGMGNDGLAGFKAVHQKGGCTITLCASNCSATVTSDAALQKGIVEHSIPMDQMIETIMACCLTEEDVLCHA